MVWESITTMYTVDLSVGIGLNTAMFIALIIVTWAVDDDCDSPIWMVQLALLVYRILDSACGFYSVSKVTSFTPKAVLHQIMRSGLVILVQTAAGIILIVISAVHLNDVNEGGCGSSARTGMVCGIIEVLHCLVEIFAVVMEFSIWRVSGPGDVPHWVMQKFCTVEVLEKKQEEKEQVHSQLVKTPQKEDKMSEHF